MEDLGHLSEEMFLASIKSHRKTSRFFPTVADILERYAEIVRNIPKPTALPEPLPDYSPEEQLEIKKMIKEFKKKRDKIGEI